MTRSEYYRQMRALALAERQKHGLTTPRVLRSHLNKIYKSYGIQIDRIEGLKSVRGAYYNDSDGISVAVNKKLPGDPMVFTLCHELKHHLVDSSNPEFQCGYVDGTSDAIEIGAEVFAAEFIFPEDEYVRLLAEMGVVGRGCTAEDLVHLKRSTRTTLSYEGLKKRAVFLGLAPADAFKGVQFVKLEESLYGKPFRRTRKRV